MAQEKKLMLKPVEKQDRISDLPDALIHHILSFLPSTKQAIQTGILLKRWRKQWTQVRVLIFNSTGMSHQNLLNFVENTLILYASLQICTFHLQYGSRRSYYPRHVDDLSLSCAGCKDKCFLPEFLFKVASLVKLRTRNCSFIPNGKVNWVNLKELKLVGCSLSNQAMEYVLSGCPLLELFKLVNCAGFYILFITSISLKKLVLRTLDIDFIEISCQNLEKLSITRLRMYDPWLFDQAIRHVLSNCLLLESFTLGNCHSLRQLVIASQSLRRLAMGNIHNILCVEMCCQNLEYMKIWGDVTISKLKFRNVSSSLRATLDFTICGHSAKSFIEDILQQLQHVKEITMKSWIIEKLTNFEVGGLFSPMLNSRCLILDQSHWYIRLSRIACLLRNLPILETLVVKLILFSGDPYNDDKLKLNVFKENYWSPNAIDVGCLALHLKTVKIYGIPRRDVKPWHMLSFIQFLLNNARVLENMIVALKENRHTGYTFKACERLFDFARCSEHATSDPVA